MKGKFLGCLAIVLGVVLLLSLVLNFVLGAVAVGDAVVGAAEVPDYSEVTVEDSPSGGVADFEGDRIAKINIHGVISSQPMSSAFGFAASEDMVTAAVGRLRQAKEDDRVKAVVLHIDSPGGEVTASDIIYHEVKQVSEVKPVVVCMGSMAASGGYYIACGADYLIASETTLTGSIGVIIGTMGYHEAFEKLGLESRNFTSGAFKDSLNGGREMRPDEKAYIQELVDEMYRKFAGIVSESRKIPMGRLEDGIADGRILSGIQALNLGIVDATGYLEDAYAKARELGGAQDARVIGYRSQAGFFDVIAAGKAAAATPAEIRVDLLPGNFLEGLQPGRAYFLPSHLMP